MRSECGKCGEGRGGGGGRRVGQAVWLMPKRDGMEWRCRFARGRRQGRDVFRVFCWAGRRAKRGARGCRGEPQRRFRRQQTVVRASDTEADLACVSGCLFAKAARHTTTKRAGTRTNLELISGSCSADWPGETLSTCYMRVSRRIAVFRRPCLPAGFVRFSRCPAGGPHPSTHGVRAWRAIGANMGIFGVASCGDPLPCALPCTHTHEPVTHIAARCARWRRARRQRQMRSFAVRFSPTPAPGVGLRERCNETNRAHGQLQTRSWLGTLSRAWERMRGGDRVCRTIYGESRTACARALRSGLRGSMTPRRVHWSGTKLRGDCGATAERTWVDTVDLASARGLVYV